MKIIRLYCSVEGCYKSFRSEEQLADHLRAHSAEEEIPEDQNTFECEICLAKYPTKRSVSAHKRIHKTGLSTFYSPSRISITSSKFRIVQASEKAKKAPFIIENIELPPIIGPTPAVLPNFHSIFKRS